MKRIPPYSSHVRPSAKNVSGNGTSVLARKLILQASVSILLVFLCILCLNSPAELPQSILSEIRTRVVERNITVDDIVQSFTETYEECVQYIQGNK